MPSEATAPPPEPPAYDGPKLAAAESFGLRHNALSPLETLAQSISTIAPSTSPQLTIPLVFVLAGQGTAIAYLIAMGLMVLVGLCIAAFARESSSPGSLYVYTRQSLPPIFSSITALALFFAYITTASAVIGGFVAFAYVFLNPLQARFGLPHIPALVLVSLAAATAGFVAYHDVKVSARLMLYIEGISVTLIAIVTATLLLRHGFHFDHPQLHLQPMSPRGIGLGVMLAIFSFVGFESATTLGSEARNPLRTIPRAVIQSALLAGVFFVVAGYGEVLGFRNAAASLGDSTNPFRYLQPKPAFPSSALSLISASSSACSPPRWPASSRLPESFCSWPTTASRPPASPTPTPPTKLPAKPASSPRCWRFFQPRASFCMEPAVQISMAGWAR